MILQRVCLHAVTLWVLNLAQNNARKKGSKGDDDQQSQNQEEISIQTDEPRRDIQTERRECSRRAKGDTHFSFALNKAPANLPGLHHE
jgi:hypothetical protein